MTDAADRVSARPIDDRPAISVVLPTADRTGNLERWVPALLRSARLAASPTEVLIVNNGATEVPDGWLQKMSALAGPTVSVRQVKTQFRGTTRARLVGSLLARSDVILMVDDDVEVPASWVEDVAAPLIGRQADLIASRVVLGAEVLPLVPAELRSLVAENDPPPGASPKMVGAAFGFRREIFAGAFWDANVGGGAGPRLQMEDVLFEMTARASGARIEWSLGPPAVHHPDVRRFDRRSWILLAQANGRSEAYVQHHLVHTSVRFLAARALWYAARLAVLRARRPTQITVEEIDLVIRKCRSWRLRIERKAAPPSYRSTRST